YEIIEHGPSLRTHRVTANSFCYLDYHVIATRLAFEDGSHLDEIDVQHVPVDVTKQDDIDSLRDVVEKVSGGSLAILVNNAGVCSCLLPFFLSFFPSVSC